MSSLEDFLEQQPRLLGLAYRMLGRHTEAEDVVQDAFLRWNSAPQVQHPRAFLTRVVTRLCLDRLRSAAHRREDYPGTWLPEPVVTGPEQQHLQATSLHYAVLRLLQELNPKERAAYLLREIFDHHYAELAEWLEESQENCRQLVSRAARKLQQPRQRFAVETSQWESWSSEFFQALARADLTGLKSRMHSEVVMWSDGGGKVRAALLPVYGSDRVARFLLGIARKQPETLGQRPRFLWLNGLPALILEHPTQVVMFDLAPNPAHSALEDDQTDGRAATLVPHSGSVRFSPSMLTNLYLVSNPEKLRHLSA